MNANKKILAAAVISVLASSADAIPTRFDFDVTGPGWNVTWEGIDDESAASDFNLTDPRGSRAIAINDASTPTNSDAYDDAFALAVNGRLVDDFDNDVDVFSVGAGTRVVAQPDLPGSLTGSYDMLFFNDNPLVRLFFSVTNNASSRQTARVEFASDLGSDGDARVEAEGNDDRAFDAEDAFVLFRDDSGSDPNLLFTFFGTGAATLPATSGLFDGDDVNSLFELDLAAGETQSLVFFGGVFDTRLYTFEARSALAYALTGTLSDLSANGYLDELDAERVGSIVNYSASTPTSLATVPEPASLLLIGTGLCAAGFTRRRLELA